MAKPFDTTLEGNLPVVNQNGLYTNKQSYFGATATFDSGISIVGPMNIGASVTVTGSISASGVISSDTDVAATATGAQAFGVSSLATLGIYYGSGAPANGLTAATGSWYMRTDGSGTGNRAYINAGGTAWTAVITNA